THIEIDIRDRVAFSKFIKTVKPDIVFHLAAQAILLQSYNQPVDTYETNVNGSINLLEAIRTMDYPCDIVVVTSDKCYENTENPNGYQEGDRLGGFDPYSSSKAMAELACTSYYCSYFSKTDSGVSLCTARAGNIIGGGDWGQNRLVPDVYRAWSEGLPVEIRNPSAIRPWNFVLDTLQGYLHLAWQMNSRKELNGEAFNFGPQTGFGKTVAELIGSLSDKWPGKEVKYGDIIAHETNILKLDTTKANKVLGWQSLSSFNRTIELTHEWYYNYYRGKYAARELTRHQIGQYQKLMADSSAKPEI
ncbi:MAG: CDP-glucose 4,6-dehydratase, partial [Cytophagales bacterium]|nr:CDP-glucose 4,6-dehydratase [Cytophagales bacterium]